MRIYYKKRYHSTFFADKYQIVYLCCVFIARSVFVGQKRASCCSYRRRNMGVKKENKDVVVRVRMTELEYKNLQKKAEDSGLTVSELIRVCCSRKKLTYRVTPEELERLRDIILLKNIIVWLNNSYKSKNFDEVKKLNIDMISELKKIISIFK